jgi:hypothetical protein
MKCIKTYDKQEFTISDQQAEKLFELSAKSDPPAMVEIDGQMIAFNNISSIVDYSEPTQQLYSAPKLPPNADPKKSKQAGLWWIVIRRNKDLMLEGKLPEWVLQNGEIVSKPYYWR